MGKICPRGRPSGHIGDHRSTGAVVSGQGSANATPRVLLADPHREDEHRLPRRWHAGGRNPVRLGVYAGDHPQPNPPQQLPKLAAAASGRRAASPSVLRHSCACPENSANRPGVRRRYRGMRGRAPVRSRPDAGQLILISVPVSSGSISRSSTRPVSTASLISVSSGSSADDLARFGSPGWSDSRASPPAVAAAADAATACALATGSRSLIATVNRPGASAKITMTGRSGASRACSSTAREHASPTARRTSSSTASSTPHCRATADATNRAVRT